MAGEQQCNLGKIMLQQGSWTLGEMAAVEAHVLAGTCQNTAHHSLKDVMKKYWIGHITPLLDACMNGHFEGVKHIIEVWRVDVETTATLFMNSAKANILGLDGDRLNGVTPLFVAALKNDVEIVRYLVGKGANVSARTSADNKGPFAGITPLHAALLAYISQEADCLKQTDVIRILLDFGADPSALSSDGTPIWMFGWLGFYHKNVEFPIIGLSNSSAISLLLEYGMSIDQRCPRLDTTLLHHMAGPACKFNEDKIVKLLLEKGASCRIRDKEGITPILFAAIGNNQSPNMLILKFFMEKDDIPNTDKIEALELAAAVFLGVFWHHTDIEYCLSRAQELRKIEGITLIQKTPSNERAVEWITSSKLENIQQRRLEFRMQSILIRLRIFSALSWGAICRYLLPCYDRFFNNFFGESSHRELAVLLDISWIMLETISRFAPSPDAEETISLVMDKIVVKLMGTLCILKKKNDPLFNAETLKTSFQLLSTSLQAQSNFGKDNPPSRTIKRLGRMFSFLMDLPDAMMQPISNYLKDIVSLNNQAANQEKLIVLACKGEYYNNGPLRRFLDPNHPFLVNSENALAFFHFLLLFGADADAVDGDGNGPLHFLAEMPDNELTNTIALLLLDAGAHLDRANKDRLTATDVWKLKRQQERRMRREEDHQADGWEDLPDWLRGQVPRLMCFAARTVRIQRVPYSKVLPPSLKSFVSYH